MVSVQAIGMLEALPPVRSKTHSQTPAVAPTSSKKPIMRVVTPWRSDLEAASRQVVATRPAAAIANSMRFAIKYRWRSEGPQYR